MAKVPASKNRKVFSFDCSECDKKFKSEDTLARHIAAHSGSKPFNCDVCNGGFSSAVALKEHKAKHEGIKLYECSECHKTFRQNSSYSRHLRTHIDEFPFECPECIESFSQKPYLVSHMKTHTDIKPYDCKQCSKSFSHRSGLNRHNLTHTGKKPYECPICDACFSDVSSRSRHVRNHVAQCGLCKISFSDLEGFKCHILDVHRSGSKKQVNSSEHNSKSEDEMSALETDSKGLMIDDEEDHCSDENADDDLTTSADEDDEEYVLTDNDNMYNSQSFMDQLSKLNDEEIKLVSSDVKRNKSKNRTTIRSLVQERLQNSDSNKLSRNSCSICKAYFPDFISLKKHQFSCNHYYKCANCDLTSDNLFILKYHSKTCNQRLICDQCRIVFYSYEEMELHIRNVHIASEEGATGDIVIPMRLLTGRAKNTNGKKDVELEENETIQSLRSKLMASENKIPGTLQNTVNETRKSSVPESTSNQLAHSSSYFQNLNSAHNAISGSTNSFLDSAASQNLYFGMPNKPCQGKVNENISMTDNTNMMKPLYINSNSTAQQFVSHASQKLDFTSDYYILWLSEFANLCKDVEFPLDETLYEKISLIYKSVADSLAKPNGVLLQRKNYSVLLDICEVFSKIIGEHLKFVCEQLPE